MRLLLLSLLVGAVISWLDIDPGALVDWVQSSVIHLWRTGFQSLHQILGYVATGAAVVVPVWLVLRLTSIGARPPRRTPGPSRWDLPGSPREETTPGFRTAPRD